MLTGKDCWEPPACRKLLPDRRSVVAVVVAGDVGMEREGDYGEDNIFFLRMSGEGGRTVL